MVIKEDYKDIIIQNLIDGFIFFVSDIFKEEMKKDQENMPFIIVQLYCEMFFNNNSEILNDIKNNIFRRINLDLKKELEEKTNVKNKKL